MANAQDTMSAQPSGTSTKAKSTLRRTAEQERLRYMRNREKVIKRVIARQRERYATDPQYALYCRLRSRIRYAVRACKQSKLLRTMRLTGCTKQQLALHIESQFQEGMSWENKDDWHIDHIVPISAFDLADLEQQKCAFHYTNLRPLWAKDNRKKKDKILVEQRRFSFGYAHKITQIAAEIASESGQARSRRVGKRE